MKGLLLLIPFFLVRFGFISLLNKEAVKRAAYFPTLVGKEVVAYWIYQFSNVAIFVYLLFLKTKSEPLWLFYIGVGTYVSGLILCLFSIINFAIPSKNGINQNGLYRFSRNPMYLSYFICFIGCVLLTQSLVLFEFVSLFQITAHWIILSEERWCMNKFGEEYIQYMKKVRRYI